jgi:hypothetical protein
VFVVAMLVMTVAATVSATFFKPDRVNQVAALLTLYLVVTAVLTVKRRVTDIRGTLATLALGAAAVGIYAVTLAAEAFASPRGLVDGIPAQPLVCSRWWASRGLHSTCACWRPATSPASTASPATSGA